VPVRQTVHDSRCRQRAAWHHSVASAADACLQTCHSFALVPCLAPNPLCSSLVCVCVSRLSFSVPGVLNLLVLSATTGAALLSYFACMLIDPGRCVWRQRGLRGPHRRRRGVHPHSNRGCAGVQCPQSAVLAFFFACMLLLNLASVWRQMARLGCEPAPGTTGHSTRAYPSQALFRSS
jgi:hypothetical protein